MTAESTDEHDDYQVPNLIPNFLKHWEVLAILSCLVYVIALFKPFTAFNSDQLDMAAILKVENTNFSMFDMGTGWAVGGFLVPIVVVFIAASGLFYQAVRLPISKAMLVLICGKGMILIPLFRYIALPNKSIYYVAASQHMSYGFYVMIATGLLVFASAAMGGGWRDFWNAISVKK
ncbi:MAG TPA: hypothetical protein PKL83_04315 [bacterium]|nr:hypothetical protein [bacterium]